VFGNSPEDKPSSNCARINPSRPASEGSTRSNRTSSSCAYEHDNITVIVAVFDGDGLKEATAEDVESLHYQKYTLPTWVDDRAGSTRRLASQGGGYDDTPLIEITGEFEVDPNTDWSDLFEDRPSIPRQAGPAVSNVVIWVAVAVLVFALYYLLAQR